MRNLKILAGVGIIIGILIIVLFGYTLLVKTVPDSAIPQLTEQQITGEQKLEEPDNYLAYQSLLEKSSNEWMEVGIKGIFNQQINYLVKHCEKDSTDFECQALGNLQKIDVQKLEKEAVFNTSYSRDYGKILTFGVNITSKDNKNINERKMSIISFRDGKEFNQCEILKNSTDKATIIMAGTGNGDLYKTVEDVRIYRVYTQIEGYTYYWCSKDYNTFIFTKTPEIVDKYIEVFYE